MPPTYGHGKICYLEIPAIDVQRSAAFYTTVFGWTTRTRGDGALAFDDGVGQVSGAWVTSRPPSGQPGLLIYIMVENLEKTVAAVTPAGGTVVHATCPDIPELIAIIRDPAGNTLGLYQDRR